MAVYSMTGYASAQRHSSSDIGAALLGVELRSVNSRFLDLSFRLSEELRHHEPALRKLLSERLKRGKVELRAYIDRNATSALPEPTTRDLQRLASLQDQIHVWLPKAVPLSIAEVLRFTSDRHSDTADELINTLLLLTQQVLNDFVAAREREGMRLGQLLLDRLTQLRQLASDAAPIVPKVVEAQKQRFLTRWNEAISGAEQAPATEVAQERALAEATSYALRIDVAEELGRLHAHLNEIESVLAKGGDTGKQLDFLIQELHREANTLSSKSAALELTQISIDMKILIEQMREQVQNLE